MDPYKFTTIAHHGRALLGPLSGASVDALLARVELALPPGTRPAVLDVGCGKGEILMRAARRFGATGTGVDPNPTFVADARARTRAAGVGASFHMLPFESAPVPRGGFDLVICTGAAHAFGDYARALAGCALLVRPRGWALVGHGYWRRPPAPEYLASFGGSEDEMAPLEDTLAAPAAHGWRVVAHHASTVEEWDDYELGYEAAVRTWLKARPDDPDAAAFQERIDRWYAAYERWGRETMGFVTIVMRR